MKIRHFTTVSILVWALPAIAQQRTPEEMFGARESVLDASLSPSGAYMAFLAPRTSSGNALYVVPVEGVQTPKMVIAASGKPETISHCDWVSDSRLICTIVTSDRSVDGYLVSASRVIALNSDGSDIKLLRDRSASATGSVIDWLPGENGAVLMARSHGRDYGVDRVDTVKVTSKPVVKPKRDASEFISDGVGTVRIMGSSPVTIDGFSRGTTSYLYRLPGETRWQPLSKVDWGAGTGFNPWAVDPEHNVAYGFDKHNGRQALFTRSLDGRNEQKLVVEHSQVDVDGLIRLGRKQRVVGASYATDRRVAEYFDPDLSKLQASLSKAIPKTPLVHFVGASLDEQRLLIWAGSDTDPGRFYALDRTTKQMRPLLLSRPELDGVTLATVRSVTITASDGAKIPGYLTLPPGREAKGLPAIVLPHGGPSARDEWGFDWLSQYYAAKGYAVLQPNYRGSAGFGDSWYQNNGFQSWSTSVADVTDAGRWLVSQGIADPQKLGIVGWSYGGYAALQSAVIAPTLFKAVVAIAPVTDFGEFKNQFRGWSNATVVRKMIGSGPHIEQGSPARNVRKIVAPVLMFHGEMDANVDVSASRLMAARLRDAGKGGELIVYPGLAHGLNDAAARADMLGKSEAFLRKALTP